MRLLDKLERRFGRFAVPNVTVAIIVLQILTFGLDFASQAEQGNEAAMEARQSLMLIPQKVMDGEVWRLLTFVIVPPITNLLFAIFGWYLLYLMGTTLEYVWGAFRYNVFLLVGYLATIAAAFAFPQMPASNGYLLTSIFLAFAAVNPNFVLHIFLILPIRIKWLALITWIGYGLIVLFGAFQMKLLVLAAVLNYLLFFWREIFYRIGTGQRHMSGQASRMKTKEPEYFHICTTCQLTDRDDPHMEFRYCSQCDGDHAYCSEHLKNHKHITAAKDGEDWDV